MFEAGVMQCSSESAGMAMTFSWSSSVTLLFQSWTIQGPWQLLFTSCLILIACLVSELLKIAFHKSKKMQQEALLSVESSPLIAKEAKFLKSGRAYLLQFVLLALHIAISSALMLVVMSFNGWIFLAVVLGSTSAKLMLAQEGDGATHPH